MKLDGTDIPYFEKLEQPFLLEIHIYQGKEVMKYLQNDHFWIATLLAHFWIIL